MNAIDIKTKDGRRRFINLVVTIVLVVLLLLLPLIGLMVERETNYLTHPGEVKFNQSWVLEKNGESAEAKFPIKMSNSVGNAVLSNVLPDVMDNTLLVFYHQTQWLKVEIDGNIIYETDSVKLGNVKTTVGTYVITVPMYSSYAGKEIKVYMTAFETGQDMLLKDVMITTNYGLIASILKENAFNIVLLILMTLGMFFCLGFRVYIVRRSEFAEKKITSILNNLILFFLAGGVWMLTDREILGIVTRHPAVCGTLIYYSFTLLPILFTSIIIELFEFDTIYMRAIKYAFVIDLVLQVILFYYGVADLHSMLIITHILLIILVATTGFLLVKKSFSEKTGSKKMVLFGGVILGIFVVLSIIAFNVDFSIDYMTFVFVGIVLFEFSLLNYAVSYMRHHMKQYRDMLQAEQLTYMDVMTGMENRKSFERELLNIDEADDKDDALLIMLDLQGLKEANDKGGHDAGDKLITDAADCIKECFKGSGKCFRLGGDEFAVIIMHWAGNYAAYERNVKKLLAEKDIVMAIGASHLVDDQGMKKQSGDWCQDAEIRMYSDKTENKIGSMRDIKGNYRNVLETLVTQSENKIIGMQGHSDTVRRLSIYIASKIYLHAEKIEDLATAAKFHDIGIMGVPDEIVIKKDRLTPEEYEAVKKHTIIGDSMFAGTEGMQTVGRIIRAHHERFDGKGYPDGLKEDEIPVEAKIIAIADTIDAITSRRPYRNAFSNEHCYIELQNNSGKMFDPFIVGKVLDNWTGIEEILDARNKQRQVIADPNKFSIM